MDSIDPNLKSWLAENLLNEADPETLVQTLIGLGIAETLARHELELVRQHPYFQGAKMINYRLKKRESLLKTLDYQQRLDPDFTKLERVPLPSFETFLRDYYYCNRPGLFTGAFDHWPARQWTFQSLLQKVGREPVIELQRNRDSAADYESRSYAFSSSMPFGEFIDLLEATDSSNDFYLTARNQAFTNTGLRVLMDDVDQLRMGDGYVTPEPERAFLWVGPKGIVTPLHHDLTNNMFLQIHGQKRFRMVPAMQVPHMANNNNHVFSDFVLEDPQLLQKYPGFAQATVFDFTLGPGDCLFIPIGWWHHVVGVTASISLSFTNFNVPNQFIDYPR